MKRIIERIRLRRSIGGELHEHFEEKVADLIDQGMPESEARLQARREFGNVALLAEDSRAALGFTWLENLGQDLRYALRMLWQSPGFTAVAILSLALGIGANTAIFGLLDNLVLKSLAVGRPQELLAVGPKDQSYPLYALLRDHNRTIGPLAAAGGFSWRDKSAGSNHAVHDGLLVSGNFFDVLQLPALVGRPISPADDSIESAGGPQGPVAMLSYPYWTHSFQRDPAVLGRSINVNGIWVTIVGVTPPGFFGIHVGRSPDIFVPTQLQPVVEGPDNLLHMMKNSETTWLTVLGRTRPGVSTAQIKSDLTAIATQYELDRMKPAERTANLSGKKKLALNITLEPASRGFSRLRDRFSEPLQVLMILVAIVLLIACANVANLLLARANARQREISIRLAIGASRGRIMRQLLTESLVLSFAGGALGLFFALWSSHLLVTMLPQGPLPPTIEVTPDQRVLGFTIGLSLVTGLLFGLAPAWRATGSCDARGLQQQRSHGRRRPRFDPGKLIVVAELALAVPLLVGAGLFLSTLHNLVTVDAGFTRQNVLQMRINMDAANIPQSQWVSAYERITERVAQIPGVINASLVNRGLVEGGVTRSGPVEYPGYTFKPGESHMLNETYIGPDYFKAAGIALRLGRFFVEREGNPAAEVAIVNEEFVRRYLAGRDPIGQRYGFEDSPGKIEIVGVVADVKYSDLRQDFTPMAYYPWRQVMPRRLNTVIVRTAGDPTSLVPALRQIVAGIHPDIFVDAQTLNSQIQSSLVRERLLAHLSGFLGALAMLLACIGLYGVMAYGVTRRTSEIGIRMALGALPLAVVRMILRESFLLTLGGIAVGLPLAIWFSRLIKSLLFGMDSTSPAVLISSGLSLLAVCAIAAFLPAWRAARTDPTIALRYE